MKTPNYLVSIKNNPHYSEETGTKLGATYLNYSDRTQYKELDEVITRLKNIQPDIKRNDVAKFFNDPNKLIHGVYAAMIWGGISAVNGRDHLGKLLERSPEEVVKIIGEITELLRGGNVKEAYEYMQDPGGGKLKGVGPAFFTKLFFFISFANDFPVIAPIYDKWTQLAHNVLLHDLGEVEKHKQYFYPAKISQFDGLLRESEGALAYKDYTERMGIWSSDLGVTVNALEIFIFGKNRGTKQGRDHNNPRNVFMRMLVEFNSLRKE